MISVHPPLHHRDTHTQRQTSFSALSDERNKEWMFFKNNWRQQVKQMATFLYWKSCKHDRFYFWVVALFFALSDSLFELFESLAAEQLTHRTGYLYFSVTGNSKFARKWCLCWCWGESFIQSIIYPSIPNIHFQQTDFLFSCHAEVFIFTQYLYQLQFSINWVW